MTRREFLGLFTLLSCDMQIAQHGILGFGTANIGFLIVAGQSNAEKGVLHVSTDLLPPYDVAVPEVIYYGDDGVFRSLDPTDQDSYQAPLDASDVYAHQFYLYNRLRQAMGVDALVVCSESVGDTNLAVDWLSRGTPGARYTDLVSRVNACKTLIQSTYGVSPSAFVCLWDQGEKDGRDATNASNYQTNFSNLVSDLRTDISEPNLRFLCPLISQLSVVGSPNPVTLGATINLAKQTVADADSVGIVTSDSNDCQPSSDGVHFTTTGQYDKCTFELQAMIDEGWLNGTATTLPDADQTNFNGYSNFTRFGDILDASLFNVSTSWRMGVTVWRPSRYGLRTLISKFATTGNQRAFHWLYNGTTSIMTFNFYFAGDGSRLRSVTWTLPSLFDAAEHTLEIRYDGTVNTNDGLDRPDLYVDGSLYTTGKTLATSLGAIGTIINSSAQLAFGQIVVNGGTSDSNNFKYDGWAREFFIQNGSAVDQVRCVNLATGTDSSGNGNNGTYV